MHNLDDGSLRTIYSLVMGLRPEEELDMKLAAGNIQYVSLTHNNTVPGFFVPSTSYGVPYIQFTASPAAVGQTAVFNGSELLLSLPASISASLGLNICRLTHHL